VVERLLGVADILYRRAEAGIPGLPRACRPAIFAARHLYAAIGDEVAAAGFDSVTCRVHVPARRKLALLGRACADALRRRLAPEPQRALEQTQFLVDAVCAARLPRNWPRGVSGRILWVAELFATLKARERANA
jgi:phytoene synthase